VFVGAALWLVVNHADNLGHDYPLVRTKYGLLLGLALRGVVLVAGLGSSVLALLLGAVELTLNVFA
jgi:hypothetical protein